MKNPIKASFFTAMAVLTLMGISAQSASAQHGYHKGWRKYHVWRNEHWVWEYHPANWVIPAYLVGPAQVDVSLGWSSHPGWHRYHVYRGNRWGYVYHPSGWHVPGAWRGPHHER